MSDQVNAGMLAAYGIEGCGCYSCVSAVIEKRPFPENMMYPFIVCADCGNKRCPKASSHLNACTRSNEPGQQATVMVSETPIPPELCGVGGCVYYPITENEGSHKHSWERQ